MSASADKWDRKRETERSPMKKKFRDATISREDLDDAIANSIKLALDLNLVDDLITMDFP